MKELKQTKTYANLLAAFAGEAQARSKYLLYADKAEQEGCTEIAALFREAAAEEAEHAKSLYRLISGDQSPSAPAELLKAAGENYEWHDMYAAFAKDAADEGLEDIVRLFCELQEKTK